MNRSEAMDIIQRSINDAKMSLPCFLVDLGKVFGGAYAGIAIVFADNEDAAARLVNQTYKDALHLNPSSFGQHTNRERQCKASDCDRMDSSVPGAFIVMG